MAGTEHFTTGKAVRHHWTRIIRPFRPWYRAPGSWIWPDCTCPHAAGATRSGETGLPAYRRTPICGGETRLHASSPCDC